MFGRGFAGYEQEIKNQISKVSAKGGSASGGKNITQKSEIEYLGEITDEEKMELMQNAKAYIMSAEDEDFGILPVEAMAAGIPVIAYRSGGVKETVIDGKTGLFFNELTVESLSKAIKRFNDLNHQSMKTACQKRAEEFSKEKFMEKIKKQVSKVT